jgi:Ca2+-transporting ATPase
VMKKKPRNKSENIINKKMSWNIGVIGVMIMILTLLMYSVGLKDGVMKASTMAFTTIIFLQLVNVFIIRANYDIEEFSNKWLFIAIFISALLQLAVLYTPLNVIFKSVPLGFMDWLWIAGSCAALVVAGSVFNRVTARTDVESH